MREQTLHQVYVHELANLYGWNRPSPAPSVPYRARAARSQDHDFVDIEQQARRLDRIFEWLGKPPVSARLKTQEERR